MGLQARMSENDSRLYNPDRDLAHNFGHIAEVVAGRLEDGTWPELHEALGLKDVSMDELGEACASFCNFVATSSDGKAVSMEAALHRSGWFELRPQAQVAVMAYLGTVVLGIHFVGVREATLGGDGPAASLSYLIERGRECSKLISENHWMRRWRRIRSRIKRIFSAIRGTAVE